MRALLYLWLDFAIIAGASLLINLLLAPAPRRIARQAIADRLTLCAAVLRDAEDRARGELACKVPEGVAPVLEQLGPARVNRRLRALEETLVPGVADTEANAHGHA